MADNEILAADAMAGDQDVSHDVHGVTHAHLERSSDPAKLEPAARRGARCRCQNDQLASSHDRSPGVNPVWGIDRGIHPEARCQVRGYSASILHESHRRHRSIFCLLDVQRAGAHSGRAGYRDSDDSPFAVLRTSPDGST